VLHPSFPAGATVAGQSVATLALALVGLIGVVLTAILILLLFPGPAVRLAAAGSRILPDRAARLLVEGFRSFLAGLEALRSPRLLLLGLAWSFGFWAWNAFSFWIAMRAFGIDQGFATALFIQGVIVLGVAVPSAPGFFGTFHAAALVGLSEVYGVGESATLAFAFGYHLGMFVPVTLMGLWYAGRIGMSLREIGSAEEALDQEAALAR
jgi:glycosyltransferase 2 family protein